jgi:RNA polymerase sigma-70 factor (ECF subfamily)
MTVAPAKSLANHAEAVLVVAARLGDAHAFDELVRRRQSHLRNVLRRLCHDRSLADDLAQETFLQAWKRIGTLRADAAFGAWLRRIGVTTWLLHVRRTEAFVALEPDMDVEEPNSTSQPNVGQQLDLDAALQRLPAAARLCIVLSYCEGMSHSEIATLTNIPVGTVKTNINRGVEKLRGLLPAYAASA